MNSMNNLGKNEILLATEVFSHEKYNFYAGCYLQV